MERPIFRLPGWRYGVQPTDFEKPNLLPSQTVPDDSLSIADLLRRHMNRMAPDVGKVPIFDDDPTHDSVDMSKLNSLDLHESEMFSQSVQEDIVRLDRSIKEQKAERVRKEKAKASAAQPPATPDTSLPQPSDSGNAA